MRVRERAARCQPHDLLAPSDDLSCGAGGTYYKGTVVNVRQQMPLPTAPVEEHEAYDPWEALEVCLVTPGPAPSAVLVSGWCDISK